MSAPQTVGASLVRPDPTMVRTYAEVVFGYVEGPIAIRMLEDSAKGSRAWIETDRANATLAPRLAILAERAARARRALYVVPVTLKASGRAKLDNLAETAVLPVNLDGGDIETKRAALVEAIGARCRARVPRDDRRRLG